ncbi:MAG TPA: alpha/beta hydrolase [Gammaproteobacteria bacterium]|nr:alpha/beta hydrolase [Gammaproteobacteria bacterium]
MKPYKTSAAVIFLLCLPLIARAGQSLTLHASDSVAVFGTITQARSGNDKILLLFHQAGASRHEYDPLITTFTSLGYDTLAIDQRSGGELFGGTNETVAKRGGSTGYLDALPDLKAALDWAVHHDYRTIVAVGSSYSSSLVILLAARHQDEIDAIASFSPGEYFDDKNLIKNAAAKITIPFYITTDPREEGDVSEVLRKAQGDNIVHYRPDHGIHGASTLVKARDPQGYRENLSHFTAFLSWVASHDRIY